MNWATLATPTGTGLVRSVSKMIFNTPIETMSSENSYGIQYYDGPQRGRLRPTIRHLVKPRNCGSGDEAGKPTNLDDSGRKGLLFLQSVRVVLLIFISSLTKETVLAN